MTSDHALEKHVRDLIDYGGGLSGAASFLFHEAAKTPPEQFMHWVPEDIQSVMRAKSANPPASIADFDWIESSNYRAEFFGGLNLPTRQLRIAAARSTIARSTHADCLAL